MSLLFISDEEIISGLKSLDKRIEIRIMDHLLKKYRTIGFSIIKKIGLEIFWLDDLMTDSILDLYLAIVKGKFRGESKISTYFFKIFEFNCIDLKKKLERSNMDDIENYKETQPDPSSLRNNFENIELFIQLRKIIDTLRNPCKEIIIKSFFYMIPHSELIEQIKGITSLDSLKTQKYKCLHELKNKIKGNDDLFNSLQDLL